MIPARSGSRDIDWTNQQEGTSPTVATYSAVTARSHHRGNTLNLVRMDGGADSVAGDIDPDVWRAAATRDGGEVDGR